MPLIVACLDADVLVPILSCDFLLTAFDQGLYEPVVSEAVMEEVERNLVGDFPSLDPSRLKRRAEHMRLALEDHFVTGSVADVPQVVNTKDRHVVASGCAGGASVVVSNDKRLRSEIAAARISIGATSADAFADHLWDLAPGGVDAVIDTLVRKRTKNPITRSQLVGAHRSHFPSIAARITPRNPA